jgi:hypothetical protein
MYSAVYDKTDFGGNMMKFNVIHTAAAVICCSVILAACQQSSSDSVETVLAAPQNFTADAAYDADAQKYSVDLSWDAVEGASGYIVQKYDSDTDSWKTIALLPGSSDTSCSDTDVEEKNTCYYKIGSVDAAQTVFLSESNIKVYVNSPRKSAKWLILVYADADHHTSAYEWNLLQDIAEGYNEIMNEDGTAKAGYAPIAVAALWDGTSKASDLANSSYAIPSASFLFDITTGTTGDVLFDGNVSITANDISRTASWITDASGNQEVDMASKRTLSNFLTWAQKQYNTPADHTLLLLCDHGSGPYTDLKSADRAMCCDNTSAVQNGCIMSTDFPWVFENAGYGTAKRLAMIFTDTCMEMAAEEAYEFKDYAHYYMGSQNSEYSIAFCGKEIMTSFVNTLPNDDDVLRSLAINEINAQKSRLSAKEYIQKDAWANHLACCKDKTFGGKTVDATLINYISDSDGLTVPTYSCIDMTKLDDVVKAADTLAGVISGDSEHGKTIIDNYLRSTSPAGNTLMYGGVNNQFDLGFFAYKVKEYADSIGATVLSGACGSVETALSKAIVCAYRDGYTDTDTAADFYLNDTSTGTYTGTASFNSKDTNWFGLCISGESYDDNYWYGNKKSSDVPELKEVYSSWYAYLHMSQEHSGWNNMLKQM